MNDYQHPEIPQVDFPYEVTPLDQPEVEITSPHPTPNSPGAEIPAPSTKPIGFTAK